MTKAQGAPAKEVEVCTPVALLPSLCRHCRLEQVDIYYQEQAKELVAFLGQKGFLAEHLPPESIRGLEEYFSFILDSHWKMAMALKSIVLHQVKQKEKQS